MELELFLNECPGIPKKGISKPKNCTDGILLCRNTWIYNYQVCFKQSQGLVGFLCFCGCFALPSSRMLELPDYI